MRKHSLAVKLVLAFALIALLSAYLTTLVSSYLINRQFDRYLVDQRVSREQDIVTAIESALADGRLDEELLRDLSGAALVDHVSMRVIDASGDVVWRAEPGWGRGMMGWGRGHRWSGSLQEISYPLHDGQAPAGQVVFGYIEDPYLSPAQQTYSRNIWLAGLLAAGLVAVLGALSGWWMSRRLSEPLRSLTRKVRAMHSDERGVTDVTVSRDELYELSTAFDDLQSSLQQQELSRQQMTADIAHELRTPLAALQAQIEAIQDGVYELTPERLKACHSEVIRLTSLVADVENLARLEGGGKLELTKTDLVALVRECVEGYAGAVEQAGLELVLEVTCPIEATVDADRMKQVILNLLSNAIKYTSVGGLVNVRVMPAEEGVLIAVRDTGKGIPEADLPRVFERFYRGEKSRSRRTGGAGLGLAIAKAIVEAHGGTLTVRNVSGAGAEFIVTVPRG